MGERHGAASGLETILAVLGDRYEFDANGRLAGVHGEGILPRFVLGRASEGCVWRFSANLEPESVRAVARLAGREPGFPIAGEKPAPPPERLVMIERLLADGGVETEPRHEVLTRGGVEIAELWTID
jgi:hypothetical protein